MILRETPHSQVLLFFSYTSDSCIRLIVLSFIESSKGTFLGTCYWNRILPAEDSKTWGIVFILHLVLTSRETAGQSSLRFPLRMGELSPCSWLVVVYRKILKHSEDIPVKCLRLSVLIDSENRKVSYLRSNEMRSQGVWADQWHFFFLTSVTM